MDTPKASWKPRSLAEMAWYELRDEILTGKLQPGNLLALKEQAARLGLSIMPVREAIARLQQEGLVVHQPQRGAYVAPVSVEEMEDLYQTRIALECLAVKLACGKITQADYDWLSRILDQFAAAYNAGDIPHGQEHHREFHVRLYRLARSSTLDRLIPPLVDNSGRYRNLSIGSRGSVADRRAEHQQILDACMASDEARAVELMTQHLSRTVWLVRPAGAPHDDHVGLSQGGFAHQSSHVPTRRW